MVDKAAAAVVGFDQLVALDHRAHRAVKDDDALLQDGGQQGAAGIGFVHQTEPAGLPR